MGRASNFSPVSLSPLFRATEIWCGSDGDETSHHQHRGQKVSMCLCASVFLLIVPPICFTIINHFSVFQFTHLHKVLHACTRHTHLRITCISSLYNQTIHINAQRNLSFSLSLRTYKVRFNSVSSYSDTRKSSSDEPETKANFESTGPLANVRYCGACM